MLRSFLFSLLLSLSTACNAQPEERHSIPLGSGASLHLTVAPFDSTAHAITRYPGAGTQLIDGHPFFGSDGEVPRTTLTSAELEVGGERVPLDVSGMFNPWFVAPPPDDLDFFRLEPLGIEGGWLVRGLFSDAAGAYMAEWLVLGGSSLRTVLTNDDRVMRVLYGWPE